MVIYDTDNLNHIQNLFYYYNSNSNSNSNCNLNNDNKCKSIICKYPQLAYRLFIPLPTTFLPNKSVEVNNNQYKFIDTSNQILLGDRLLPFNNKNNVNVSYPIPFLYNFIQNNKINLIASNVYYYEITLISQDGNENENIDKSQNNLSVGYGNYNININNNIKSANKDSFIFSSNGIYKYAYLPKQISPAWKSGDTIGIGIIYSDVNRIKSFFTYNGKLIFKSSHDIMINDNYFPIIICNYPCTITVNFSTKPFSFNIMDIIKLNSNKIYSIQNDFLKSHNVNKYKNKFYINNKNVKEDDDELIQEYNIQNQIPISNNILNQILSILPGVEEHNLNLISVTAQIISTE